MSSFSIGQMNQFGDALEAVGGNAKHLTRLGQTPAILENLIRVLDGEAVFQLNEQSPLAVTEPLSDLERWGNVYEKLFGHKPYLSEIRIPEKPEGVGPVRLIVVVKEIFGWTSAKSLQGTQKALKSHFPCYQYDNNLDKAIPTNDRDPRNGSYAVWVKDMREADEDMANLSADDLAARNIPGITMLERQLLEADYFFENAAHLDIVNVTLCSGSRNADGHVPFGCWYDGRFDVGWYNASNRDSDLRSRRVWA